MAADASQRLPDAAWAVLELLRNRVPGLSWHPGRIALALADHPNIDPISVAGRCADWIAFRAERVADGPATFRQFCERASRELAATDGAGRSPKSHEREDLDAYDVYLN